MDILSETRLSLTELARREGVAIPTVWRWRKKGVKGVRLETFVVGSKPWTTEEAFARFVQRTTAVADGQQAPAARTARQRQKAITHAELECDEAGI